MEPPSITYLPPWVAVPIISGVIIWNAITGPWSPIEGPPQDPAPEPAHCYEWVDGDWMDICI